MANHVKNIQSIRSTVAFPFYFQFGTVAHKCHGHTPRHGTTTSLKAQPRQLTAQPRQLTAQPRNSRTTAPTHGTTALTHGTNKRQLTAQPQEF